MPLFKPSRPIQLEAYDFEYRKPTKEDADDGTDLSRAFPGFTGKNAYLFHLILMAGAPVYPMRLSIQEVLGCTLVLGVLGDPGKDEFRFGPGSTNVYVPPYQRITLINPADNLCLRGQILMIDPKVGEPVRGG
jgi:hypothetical protein